ncbi:U1 small nuclear ribonucleoprotein 70 kDa [Trichinella pseudospiralis]|uniref:U1 small nuclear ribonucleoprotein 70 kDa n=1 Tax=Trichinella pseudospiralis TaxID=6337 RepID=A0A0V1EVF3_TRIPS|nr:U1 small nuclear ribonucleoprotein 70 kDa [Trichinella pseudospiralis]
MTQFLPPNLLALFAPRDPLPYLPPIAKLSFEKKRAPYSGVAKFIHEFENPNDTPPPVKVETREERIERKRRERAELQNYKIEQGIATWNPSANAKASTDPFKTLFVARLSYDTTETKLRREFEVYGPIKKIYMITDIITGKSRGYAFIEYEHEADMHGLWEKTLKWNCRMASYVFEGELNGKLGFYVSAGCGLEVEIGTAVCIIDAYNQSIRVQWIELFILNCLNGFSAAYKHADGKKIDKRRVLVDVERGRTVKNWLPRRLGGGLGNTRRDRPPAGSILHDDDDRMMYSSSGDRYRDRDYDSREYERSRRRSHSRDRERGGDRGRRDRDDYRDGRGGDYYRNRDREFRTDYSRREGRRDRDRRR